MVVSSSNRGVTTTFAHSTFCNTHIWICRQGDQASHQSINRRLLPRSGYRIDRLVSTASQGGLTLYRGCFPLPRSKISFYDLLFSSKGASAFVPRSHPFDQRSPSLRPAILTFSGLSSTVEMSFLHCNLLTPSDW